MTSAPPQQEPSSADRDADREPDLVPGPDPDLVPLSAAQEAIWLEQLLHPDEVNGGFLSVLLRGEVTADQVRAACATVCAAHPQTRALVVTRGDDVFLSVRPVAEVLEFETVRLPAAEGTERDAARAWYREHRAGPWDLTVRAPVAHALLDHGPGRRTLVLGVHHIAFDGRSKFVFARAFLAALRAERQHPGGQHPGTPAPAAPRATREPVDAAELDSVVGHWLAADLPRLPGLALPRDDAPPRAAGAPVLPTPRFDLSATTAARLRELTARADVSMFTGLLAGVAALLHAHGNDRFVLGVPVDTSLPGTRDRIGLQVNVVPCLLDVPPGTTFRRLLAVAGEALATVRRFRRVPFSWVLRELRRRHGVDVTRGAFDGVGVSYPSVAADLGEVPGLDAVWDFFAPNSTRSFDLIVQLRREPDAVYGRLDHAASVLSPAAAARFTDGYARLLARAVEHPDAPLSALVEGHVTAPAAEDLPGPAPQVHGGVAEFQPTARAAALSRRVGPLRLELADPVLGRLGACAWHPDDPLGLWLARPAPGLALRVTTADGRVLPRGVPGRLGHVGDPRPGTFTAWIDGHDRVRLLGDAGRVRDWVGRRAVAAEVEFALAALPGVEHAHVDLGRTGADGTPPAPRVRLTLTANTNTPADNRTWRRTVRRHWPAGWPAPAEVDLGGTAAAPAT
ncbi:condensation domain-containing protein [Streptomyces sp. NPDC008150]|uniref:condensation domain-containing protein n=1 Tax=Streptomyces sp. NPDC008150 TaxID=3364816 RepID=UPI0036E17C50